MTDKGTAAVEVQGLMKSFGEVVALDGLDTAGRAKVLGHDVVGEPLAVRRRIGLAGQFAAVDEELTGREPRDDRPALPPARR